MKDPVCSNCNHKLVYSEGYDAKYCRACNVWAETDCMDPQCMFCRARPEKPLPLIYNEAIEVK